MDAREKVLTTEQLKRRREYQRKYYNTHRKKLQDRSRIFQKKHRDNNLELHHEREVAYRERHHEEVRKRERAYYANNRKRVLERQKRQNVKHRDRIRRITSDEYTALLDEQEGRCAICRTDNPGPGKQAFCIDHCHKTGQIRGLLCGICNRALGLLNDDLQKLEAAVVYLRRYQLIRSKK